jgi:SNF2 family DNA or RNA helicase
MTRLRQITGGYVKNGEETIELVFPDKNPKFLECLDIIEDAPRQSIVWSSFTAEISGLCALLEEKKISYRRFDGQTSDEDRRQASLDFVAGKFDVMVANPAAGGTGQNWYTADTVVYLSNSAKTEDRVQSEDRAHRKGTISSVTYNDIVVPGTEDIRTLRIVKGDIAISDAVMEALSDWNA